MLQRFQRRAAQSITGKILFGIFSGKRSDKAFFSQYAGHQWAGRKVREGLPRVSFMAPLCTNDKNVKYTPFFVRGENCVSRIEFTHCGSDLLLLLVKVKLTGFGDPFNFILFEHSIDLFLFIFVSYLGQIPEATIKSFH